MQSTAGSVLRPSWRGITGSPSAGRAIQHFRQNLPLLENSSFARGALVLGKKCFHGDVLDLRPKFHSTVTSAGCTAACSSSGVLMSALSKGPSGVESGGGISEVLTAVGRREGLGKATQRRGVRTRASRGLLEAVNEIKNPVIEKDLEFESPLDIVLYPDPRLRAKNAAIRKFDSKLEALCKEMFDVMYRTDGVGLSAPQVGVNFRVMVYNPEGVKGEGVEYVLVNPKIISSSKKLEEFTEGCLSFPEINADVVRPLDVKVQAQNLQGKRFTLTLKGWKARIFQHEYDHLEGILFHDRMTEEARESIYDELLELEKAYAERTGQPPPETVQKA